MSAHNDDRPQDNQLSHSASSASSEESHAGKPPDNKSVSDVAHPPAQPLPLRMLNEYAYCPRLFHLIHVEGRWAENEFTLEGKQIHSRVDRTDHLLPDAPDATDENNDDHSGVQTTGDDPPTVTRSVSLSSDRLGITAKLDLVSIENNIAVPVDTKRGRVPDNPERSWEPERVQLMAQGLLLREHGYQCEQGVLYFAGSRTRVPIDFTPELEARTLHLIEQSRQAAQSRRLPDPLDDSPKCNGCSLNAICLPDETLALRETPPDQTAPHVRRLYPARDDAQPLYVQEHGAIVTKRKNTLIIKKKGEELAQVRLRDISQLVLCGNIMLTAQTIHLLAESSIPIVHMSMGHWFYAITSGITLRNAYDRAAQFQIAADPTRQRQLAQAIVTAKGINQRTLLRRNSAANIESNLREMSRLLEQAGRIEHIQSMLGIEGSIARQYFSAFSTMLKPRDFDSEWNFDKRNKRPPRDPVNALLSFAYAMLAKECTVALLSEGLDPWWGIYHQPRHGRPSLALDLMEEFRPLIADSAVVTAINTGMVAAKDFNRTKISCMLNKTGRKGFIRAYEARLDQLVTHPIFDYRCCWRSVIRLQARLLARWFRGDVPQYTGMTTR